MSKKELKMTETVFSWDTKLSADTVEWCPNEGQREYGYGIS